MAFDPSGKEVDFSHFFDKEKKPTDQASSSNIIDSQNITEQPKASFSRVSVLLIILLILAAVQIGLIIYNRFQRTSNPVIPPGYHMESSPTAPPRLEKN